MKGLWIPNRLGNRFIDLLFPDPEARSVELIGSGMDVDVGGLLIDKVNLNWRVR
jgi:hypothetical protein